MTSMLERAREAMQAAGCWSANQQMGMRWPVGCVALEVTQRCNLDCTLCYLSENAEAVPDVALEELFRRIDGIREHYGPNTDVQVTGGEPTLRRRDELVAIVRRVRERGLRPTLMTNGRRATRELLCALAEAGLVDVAFHVDTTQQLEGCASESDLNALRAKYLDRVRGLPLSVMFNTTVHDGNFAEIPEVVRFFRANAGRVRTASFQVQAQTGRGVHEKAGVITLEDVAAQIERGAGTSLNFRGSLIGHPRCNRYALCLAANGALHDALDDARFVERLQPATAHLVLDRVERARTVRAFLGWLAAHPRTWAGVAKWTLRKAWQMKADLAAARGRVQTLSFIVHGFMDAAALEQERIEACVFMAMTRDGPVSMCLHNARRDAFLSWQPLRGAPTGLKYAKGRARQRLLAKAGA
jgi:uncharacterized radical SAM superfamily Fe-S cluster-containing enzyme